MNIGHQYVVAILNCWAKQPWTLFDRHLDIAEAARQMLDPDERERLQKIIRGAIRASMKQERQSVTERSIEIAARQIVSHLKTGGEL